jgi:hypothetical protein
MHTLVRYTVGLLILVHAFPAFGFDCNHPDFGARIAHLNKDGYFIKYMEKGGISYYNYTGPCQLEMHAYSNPTIRFGFIQDQLYARFITIPRKEGQSEDIRDKLERNIPKNVGTQAYSMKQEGDWWIYQWFDEKDKVKYKIKVNALTNEGKSVCYYEPLREKLPYAIDDDDS